MEDWLYGALDLLASEYGWWKDKILYEVYPEDFFLLARQIRMRKLDNLITQFSVATHPHRETEDQQAFMESLLNEHRFMSGEEAVSEELDIVAFENLRTKLSEKSLFIKTDKTNGE